MTPSATTDAAGYVISQSADGNQLFFEYGMASDDPTVPSGDPSVVKNIAAHTVTISDGTVLQIPEKQWRTHFRYPWVTDQVAVSPKYLVDNNLMFPFSAPPGVTLRAINSPVYDGPNAFPGMDRGWGDTGERPELGLLSEWASDYMRTAATTALLNVAEGASTAPVFYVDKNTGKPVSRETYPSANNYGSGLSYHGPPWFPSTPGGFKDNYDDPLAVKPSMNHAPEPSYLATLITRSPWHLRNLQFWANYFLIDNGGRAPDNISFITPEEIRSLAWGLRTVAMAEAATREFERLGIFNPAIHLPSSYFKNILLETLNDVLLPAMADPDNQVARVLCVAADKASYAPWQHCYLLEALSFIVLMGHSEFNAVYLWALGGLIAQTNGTSGWPSRAACVYWIGIGAPGARYKSWAEIFQNAMPGGLQYSDAVFPAAMAADLKADPNGPTLPTGLNDEYPQSALGVLAAAIYLDSKSIAAVKAQYPELQSCYDALLKRYQNWDVQVQAVQTPRGSFFNNRVAFATSAASVLDLILQPGAAAPPAIPPPDPPPAPQPAPEPVPVTQPPMENPPMTDALDSLKVAVETIKADVAAEIKAVHDRIAAIVAAAQGGTVIDPTELQAQVDALNALHTNLTADTAALPTATS